MDMANNSEHICRGGYSACKESAEAASRPNSDLYQLADVLTAKETEIVQKVRVYMETKVQPIINSLLVRRCLPVRTTAIVQGIGQLRWPGLRGLWLRRAVPEAVRLSFAMELARVVDASFATFFGVHSGLAMGSIYLDGTGVKQKQKWLPPMARFEKIVAASA